MIQLKAIRNGEILTARRYLYYSLAEAKKKYRAEFNLKHKKLEWIVSRGQNVLY